jgi:hypothetical protein
MVPVNKSDLMYSLIVDGDVSKLTPDQQVQYYQRYCESLNLNPVTKPFDYIRLNGKLVLYAKKDATEQLRKNNGVSVVKMESKQIGDVWITQVEVQDKTGRTDVATGAVNIAGLKGDNLANAVMKCETKAKRRATLSICGLGVLDETELETIPNNVKEQPKNITGDTTSKKKGDYKGASAVIANAKSLTEVEKYEALLTSRIWTDEEFEGLRVLIELKKGELEAKDESSN